MLTSQTSSWSRVLVAHARTLIATSCSATWARPDGRHVVSASEDRTLKVWELASGHVPERNHPQRSRRETGSYVNWLTVSRCAEVLATIGPPERAALISRAARGQDGLLRSWTMRASGTSEAGGLSPSAHDGDDDPRERAGSPQ